MRFARLTHPALLILTLAVIYSLTIGVGDFQPGDSPPTLTVDEVDEDKLPAAIADLSDESHPQTVSLPEPVQQAPVDIVDADSSQVTSVAAGEPESASVMDVVDVSEPSTAPAASRVPVARPPIPVADTPQLTSAAAAPPAVQSNADTRESDTDAHDSLALGGPIEDESELQQQRQPQIFVHVVQAGETLTDIARAYGVDVDTLLAANSIPNPNRIRVGDELDVLNVKGVLHEVQAGESLWDIARFYEVPMSDIIEANSLSNPDRIRVGQRLVIPGAQALAALRRSEALISTSGQLLRNFSWPVTGRISSHFGPRWGRMHNGLDIAVVTGTPVRASAAGRVTFSGWNGGYGYLVIIDHGNNIETRYAYNSRLLVQAGDRVRRGDVVALSGNTGNSTGPHVHFEIRRNGQPLNPIDFLR